MSIREMSIREGKQESSLRESAIREGFPRKRSLRLRVASLFLAVLFLGMQCAFAALQFGSQGNEVTQVQQRLKNWGYYDGAVDGVYGSGTVEAVKYFQRKNGLNPDGVVGSATAAALGVTLGGVATASVSRGSSYAADVNLLARLVHGEARGEIYKGKVAVAAVVLNRVRSPKFPNTIAGVIYQPDAFTCVNDGQINLMPDNESIRAANDALNGWDPTGGCIYYFNPSTATSSWIWSRPVVIVIGRHRFCK